MTESQGAGCFKTKLSLLWMNLSSEPLIAVYSLMPVILRKELGATLLQIALFTMLSPVLSVLSFYWGAWLSFRKHQLLSNFIGAWVLARIPFLFFPYIDTFWAMFVSCGIYQLFSRAATPALMEILKRNIPQKNREYVFSLYYVLSVVEGILISLLLTQVLTLCDDNWRMLFLICSLISLTSLFVQLQIKIPSNKDDSNVKLATKNKLTTPIKESVKLIQSRPDFATFQWGFMIGGFALMLISPARSLFIADLLPVSIADLTTARCMFVGLGMAGSALIWKKALEIYGIHKLTPWILVGFGLYPLFLLLASVHIAWFYLSHLAYGIAQGGSHLVWHLSGTIFAGDQNSTPFTTTNILMIGLRGAIGPALGGLLCYTCGPVVVLLIGTLMGLCGGWLLLKEKPLSLFTRPLQSIK